ncbi:MAG: FAD-dependent oxidoreductase [Coriobacteriales bacterium]|nr:FAD-dependent oxidoreductase [Coriobacteriales bacterium]
MKYTHLFEPIVVQGTFYKNRIFASPQDIYKLDARNYLENDATYFYEMKAMGGFSSVCVGDMMTDKATGFSHPFQLDGSTIAGRVGLTRTANAIARHGAVPAIELNHGGQNSMPYEGGNFVYGNWEGVRADGVEVRMGDAEWIERLIGFYADAATFARNCGFKQISIHGGHGWLLHQFISERDNKRTDEWGGSFENRMRFPIAVIEAIRKKIGRMPIDIRISGEELLPGGYDMDEGVRIAKALDGLADIINVSVGHHEYDEAAMVTHPMMFLPDGVNVKYAAACKKAVSTSLISTVGALCEPEQMEEILATGQADFVMLGRESLAEPDFPNKVRMGKEDEINKCFRCFTCFSRSTASGIFYCAINPVVGNESELFHNPVPNKLKKVLVAGGGVGGMQAAITAAELGHEVILCEKGDQLGGNLRCEQAVPFKLHLHHYLDKQALLVERSNIDLRLNTEVTPEYAREVGADVIIAALGARPATPPIPGIEKAYLAEEIYRDAGLAGEKVVIAGAGLVGLELGVYLGQMGKDVTIIEMAGKTLLLPDDAGGTSERISAGNKEEELLPPGAPIVQGVAITQVLKGMPNVRVFTRTKALEFRDNGILAQNDEGEVLYEADTVINAMGMKALTDEMIALSDCAPEFYAIGDCIGARNMVDAVQEGWQAARDLGRL